MSFNILDAVKSHLTPNLISKASSFLGESDSAVGKAISGILPSVLGGLISKSSTDNAGATEVFNMSKEANSSGFMSNLGDIFSDGGGLLSIGSGLVKSIFGSKADGIIDSIAGFAGVKKSSANSLMSMIAPVALSTLGNHAKTNNLNSSGLLNLLSSQKSSILNMLPDGLSSLAGMVGLGKISNSVSSASERTRRNLSATNEYDENTTRKAGGMKWLLPLLLLIGALILAWYLWKGCNKSDGGTAVNGQDTIQLADPTVVPTTTNKIEWPSLSIDSLSGIINYDLGKEIEFSLPDGATFKAPEKGFESQLITFIKDGVIDTVDKSANWFNMFDVQFKTGGNEYTGKADAQLKNCAAILKAYPFVKIKLGGYTDNTGSADGNTKISQQRADKVKADLIKMGATADQITEAVGYGPLYPVCEANDTPDCKARNRRVACKVAVK
jgi:OmpA-OmpF porin, OOP family